MGVRNMTKKEGRISMIFPSFCVPKNVPICTPNVPWYNALSFADLLHFAASQCDRVHRGAVETGKIVRNAKTHEFTRLVGFLCQFMRQNPQRGAERS